MYGGSQSSEVQANVGAQGLAPLACTTVRTTAKRELL
jgi:hypothetical protein